MITAGTIQKVFKRLDHLSLTVADGKELAIVDVLNSKAKPKVGDFVAIQEKVILLTPKSYDRQDEFADNAEGIDFDIPLTRKK